MKARMGAKDMIARLHAHAPRAPRASPKSVAELTESERLRITRFVVGREREQPDLIDAGVDAWHLEVYGFGSSVPLAHQRIELPTDRTDQSGVLDEVLASLSLVRWGTCMADAEGTRIEGCCVQDFAESPQRTMSGRHIA